MAPEDASLGGAHKELAEVKTELPPVVVLPQVPLAPAHPLRVVVASTSCSSLTHGLSYEDAIANAPPVHEDMRCKYKTGRCPLARAMKRSGRPLLLCEYHRLKQNSIKRKSDTKYRQDRKAHKTTPDGHPSQGMPMMALPATPRLPPHTASLLALMRPATGLTPTGDMGHEEIDMLSYFIL
ncbi:Aste57867_7957 [Aphanomyces stellatus]|uniref:Aste57867_7957 protein n=1 Tax=Aphanomyces stellatus TaxID=120398 RepID=A0A485KJ22_9STRA|nr:hypothetical protein As57867_007927 [Aphanomyces stellatus]VFT84850.1 Aste57867_7957 [Aphanomyces stellatus]